MSRAQQTAVLFAALLLMQTGNAQAGFVDRLSDVVTDQNIQGSGYLDTFAQIDNAFRLISFDGGSIFGGEGGGTISLFVHYADNSEALLTSFPLQSFATFNLDALGNLPFAPGNITGLRFTSTNGAASQFASITLDDVTYRFEASDPPTGIPEPFSAALLGVGLLGLGWLRRRG